MNIEDKRYTSYLEFCGASLQKNVLRFCGEFVAALDSIGQCEAMAVKHAEERGHNSTGWTLLADCGGVLWLRKPKILRVAYGASVKDFKGKDADLEAAKEFGLCVRHSLECGSLLD